MEILWRLKDLNEANQILLLIGDHCTYNSGKELIERLKAQTAAGATAQIPTAPRSFNVGPSIAGAAPGAAA
jgi:hypothetical protein